MTISAKKIVAPLASTNQLSDMPDVNDAAKLSNCKEMVDHLTDLIASCEAPHLASPRIKPPETIVLAIDAL